MHLPPLGSHLEGDGVRFTLYAGQASRVEVVLFNQEPQGFNQEPQGKWRETRYRLHQLNGHQGIWSGHIPGVGVGQRYGYRLEGPWNPKRALHFNPAKLLIDPYAHLLEGAVGVDPAIFAHHSTNSLGDGEIEIRDDRDSVGLIPFSLVTAGSKREVLRPGHSWNETVIYEAHLQGLTKMNRSLPEALRGSYSALGHPASIQYLRTLGVTAIELLPIQHFATEPAITGRGRENFWGYNPISFQAIHPGYASTANPIEELQGAIDSLHSAGIEVILDLVFNHTGEGGKNGPALSWRGIDALSYYRHDEDGALLDFTGCGNTVNTSHPITRRLIIDSLLWWSEVIGVDGFRFDLTTSLTRDGSGDGRGVELGRADASEMIAMISADPILGQRKLIAEPWDISGHSLGTFPKPWREWNDRYRDGVRQFWIGQHASQEGSGVADLARRISGSDDLFHQRGPNASINFITAHDGFTLHDLVRYQEKRNQPNGESNRDGSEQNRSWNLGIEGPTTDEQIERMRQRLQKSMLATLLLSAGVPMITMGDERSRSQAGSNNAFTIDRASDLNSIENFDGGLFLSWEQGLPMERDMTETVKRLIEIRSLYLTHLISDFFTGNVDLASNRKDIAWFREDGVEMSHEDWHQSQRRQLAIFYEAKEDQGLLLLVNGAQEEAIFHLPDSRWGDSYRSIFDSSLVTEELEPQLRSPGDLTTVASHSMQVWLVHHSTVG